MALVGILANDAPKYWDVIEHWCNITLQAPRGRYTFEDIKRFILSRDMQLWLIVLEDQITGVAVTKITKWPQHKILTVVIIAGDSMEHWLNDVDSTLTEYAKSLGCNSLDSYGRPGWKKLLVSLGWEIASTVYTKELNHG